MSIKQVPVTIYIPGRPSFFWRCSDNFETFDLEEAVEHENNIKLPDTPAKVKYDYVMSIQEAINTAVAENRVVRFIWTKDNASIRKAIVDKKGCAIMKPEKDSHDVAVIPPGMNDFDFNKVDTSVSVNLNK